MEAEVKYVDPGAASGPGAASDIASLSSGGRRWVCGPPLSLFHVLGPAAVFVLFSETKVWPWAVKMVPVLDASSGRMPHSDQWERRAPPRNHPRAPCRWGCPDPPPAGTSELALWLGDPLLLWPRSGGCTGPRCPRLLRTQLALCSCPQAS